MTENNIRILCTGDISGSLVTEAGQQGFALIVCPLIQTVPLRSDMLSARLLRLSGIDLTAVFTSTHAVEAVQSCLGKSPAGWTIFCTEPATRIAAESFFGSGAIRGTGNSAGKLTDQVLAAPGIRKIYFFCGNRRREELPAALGEAGIAVEEIIVYHTLPAAVRVFPTCDGVVFFSPSAVAIFFTQLPHPRKTIFFAIGESTADAIRKYTGLPVLQAISPSKEGLVRMAIDYFQKHPVQH